MSFSALRSSSLPAFVFAALLSASCGSKPAATSGADIGSAGGAVTNGSATLVVPAGALSAMTRVTLTRITSDRPAGAVGDAYELAPADTQLASPATFTLRYDRASLPDPSSLRVVRLQDGAWVELAGAQIDAERAAVQVAITRFGRYALVRHAAPAADGGGASGAKWWFTCGDPVCRGYTPHDGGANCSASLAGSACAELGATCDPGDDCNRRLICATSDPTQQPGGCPISRLAAKRELRYLTPDDLARLAGELERLRLARYRYAWDAPDRTPRLGFVLEDVGPSAAADPVRDVVDLYGYLSMAVAAIKVQSRELGRLRDEVRALREALRKNEPRSTDSADAPCPTSGPGTRRPGSRCR